MTSFCEFNYRYASSTNWPSISNWNLRLHWSKIYRRIFLNLFLNVFRVVASTTSPINGWWYVYTLCVLLLFQKKTPINIFILIFKNSFFFNSNKRHLQPIACCTSTAHYADDDDDEGYMLVMKWLQVSSKC